MGRGSRAVVGVACVVVLLGGCGQGIGGAAPTAAPVAGARPTVDTVALSTATPGARSGADDANRRLARLRALPSGELLVQYDSEPTAWGATERFARVPPFTLYADGRLVYVDEAPPRAAMADRAVEARLSEGERLALLDRVRALGWDRLRTYTSMEQELEDGSGVAVFDSSYTILRVREPGAPPREVTIYDNFGADPEALRAIRKLLADYRHPRAEPYAPERAALLIQRYTEPAACEPILSWPLPPARLQPPAPRLDGWAVAVGGEEFRRLVAGGVRNMGSALYRSGAHVYSVSLVPWLPGEEYEAEVRRHRIEAAPPVDPEELLPEATAAPAATSEAASTPTVAPAPEGTPPLDPGCYRLR